MSAEVEFTWQNDLSIRCSHAGVWVDYSYDLGGGEKEFLLERRVTAMSNGTQPETAAKCRIALVKNLEELGYTVINVD